MTTCDEPPVPATERYPLAGPITFSGPGFSVVLPEPTPNPTGGQYELDLTQTWGPGDTLTFRSDGNEVPAFELSVAAPVAPALIEPATFVGLVIPRSEPFLIRWAAPGAPGVVGMALGDIRCSSPIATGEILVDPDLLATLAPSSDTLLFIYAGTGEATPVLDWSLYAQSSSDLPMPDPTEYSAALVTIE